MVVGDLNAFYFFKTGVEPVVEFGEKGGGFSLVFGFNCGGEGGGKFLTVGVLREIGLAFVEEVAYLGGVVDAVGGEDSFDSIENFWGFGKAICHQVFGLFVDEV